MYKLTENKCIAEEKEYSVYGIYYNEEFNIPDVSVNKEMVEKLVSQFNELELSPYHLYDVVYDMIE